MSSKKEPQNFVNRLLTRLKLSCKFAFISNLRTLLACDTLISDYKHSFRKITLGDLQMPWYTYPFLEHLNKCDLLGLECFEYGGGSSTSYLVNHTKHVTTVEKDPKWFDMIKSKNSRFLDTKLTLILASDKLAYCQAISTQPQKFYDIIVIDGNWRLSCAEVSISFLSDKGLIILDNSDWCPLTCDFLMKQGFYRLDFSGFGASNQFTWSTSIFFRSLLNPIFSPVKPPFSLGYVSSHEAGYMFEGEDK